MKLKRPEEVPPEHCPSCDTEMLFSGTQPAGLAQFFCEVCDYRHDRLIDS
jgi:transposase-like protein